MADDGRTAGPSTLKKSPPRLPRRSRPLLCCVLNAVAKVTAVCPSDCLAGSRIFDLSYHTLTANGKFLYPGWGRFQPYGLVGIGFSILQLDDRSDVGRLLDDSAVGFATRFGAGLDVYLSENWLLNAGIEMQINTATIDNANPIGDDVGSLFYIPIQFGVQYRF